MILNFAACLENKFYTNVTIRAIPCNGVRECCSGEDEVCYLSNAMIWVPFGVVLLVSKLLWATMKLFVTMYKTPESPEAMIDPYPNPEKCQNLKGDELAELKVWNLNPAYNST